MREVELKVKDFELKSRLANQHNPNEHNDEITVSALLAVKNYIQNSYEYNNNVDNNNNKTDIRDEPELQKRMPEQTERIQTEEDDNNNDQRDDDTSLFSEASSSILNPYPGGGGSTFDSDDDDDDDDDASELDSFGSSSTNTTNNDDESIEINKKEYELFKRFQDLTDEYDNESKKHYDDLSISDVDYNMKGALTVQQPIQSGKQLHAGQLTL
jgi:hypothetical protein